MGTSTSVCCSGCGYETFLMLGGGRASHLTYAAWPVRCNDCAVITTANFKSTPLACRDCGRTEVVPVTDRQEWKGDGKVIMMWDDLGLTDGHYRCPKCGCFKLRFEHGRMRWD